jgi:DDE family transposase/transposase-like protein DUF772
VPTQGDLLRSTASFCGDRVATDSIYGVLHRECFNLFPDEMFADLFTDVGRRSVPPMIVAVTMVLQRIEGLSDREAVDRFAFDARWKYAAGGLAFDYPGFVHTVLVDMRARLAASERPNRIFEATLVAAKAAGLVGRRRVLDSTPLYDAVATMDTVTLVRSAIRGLLRVADADLEAELRGLLHREDDYASAGKPACEWDDVTAREALVDALARDARALLTALDGGELAPAVARAAVLLATVVGQDLDEDADGVFRIARRVARDRVISTVDPQARHGHKTSARGFDGYKGHLAVDPDSEIITATTATPGNTGDAEAAADLLAQDLPTTTTTTTDDDDDDDDDAANGDTAGGAQDAGQTETAAEVPEEEGGESGRLDVYGDAAYGAGELLDDLEQADADIHTKVQPPTAPGGRFPKDRFDIDLEEGTVTCPGEVRVPIRPAKDGGGTAAFGAACADCPLAAQCTSSRDGRTITIGRHEEQLARARARQQDPAWQAEYRATRPKVERKIGHLMRRRHGGRRARVRGRPKVAADFALLAAAVNVARLGVLGVTGQPGQYWVVAPN